MERARISARALWVGGGQRMGTPQRSQSLRYQRSSVDGTRILREAQHGSKPCRCHLLSLAGPRTGRTGSGSFCNVPLFFIRSAGPAGLLTRDGTRCFTEFKTLCAKIFAHCHSRPEKREEDWSLSHRERGKKSIPGRAGDKLSRTGSAKSGPAVTGATTFNIRERRRKVVPPVSVESVERRSGPAIGRDWVGSGPFRFGNADRTYRSRDRTQSAKVRNE